MNSLMTHFHGARFVLIRFFGLVIVLERERALLGAGGYTQGQKEITSLCFRSLSLSFCSFFSPLHMFSLFIVCLSYFALIFAGPFPKGISQIDSIFISFL